MRCLQSRRNISMLATVETITLAGSQTFLVWYVSAHSPSTVWAHSDQTVAVIVVMHIVNAMMREVNKQGS